MKKARYCLGTRLNAGGLPTGLRPQASVTAPPSHGFSFVKRRKDERQGGRHATMVPLLREPKRSPRRTERTTRRDGTRGHACASVEFDAKSHILGMRMHVLKLIDSLNLLPTRSFLGGIAGLPGRRSRSSCRQWVWGTLSRHQRILAHRAPTPKK